MRRCLIDQHAMIHHSTIRIRHRSVCEIRECRVDPTRRESILWRIRFARLIARQLRKVPSREVAGRLGSAGNIQFGLPRNLRDLTRTRNPPRGWKRLAGYASRHQMQTSYFSLRFFSFFFSIFCVSLLQRYRVCFLSFRVWCVVASRDHDDGDRLRSKQVFS